MTIREIGARSGKGSAVIDTRAVRSFMIQVKLSRSPSLGECVYPGINPQAKLFSPECSALVYSASQCYSSLPRGGTNNEGH